MSIPTPNEIPMSRNEALSALDEAILKAGALITSYGEGNAFIPFDADITKQVSVRRMPSIPAGDNPFRHDSMSMGTPLVRGWVAMHPGYDAKTPDQGTQYPINWIYLVNTRTGNRVRIDIGENF